MSKIDLSQEEFSELVEAVLKRLANDPGAAHLWSWRSRPGCADEPAGPGRRSHLATLLGLLGGAALGGAASACGSENTPCSDAPCGDNPPDDAATSDLPACGDNPPSDAAACGDNPPVDASMRDAMGDLPACGDNPPDDLGSSLDAKQGGLDLKFCADDPCNGGQDLMYCADDPCNRNPA